MALLRGERQRAMARIGIGGFGRVATGNKQRHRGAFAAAEAGERVGLSAILQEHCRDLDGVFRRLPAKSLHAIGGNVMKQRGAVNRRIEVRAAYRADRNDLPICFD